MKKNLVLLLVISILLFPFGVLAEENEESSKYISETLEEVLTKKQIEHDLKDYKETDEQVPVYLFYSTGCGYCERFIRFIQSIVEEYGDKFKLVAYDVNASADNSTLMNDVAKFMKKSAKGVPLIVIGDKSFEGYSSEYDEDIKSQITKLYDESERYDVMEEMKKPKKGDTMPILVISLIVIAGVGGLIFIARKND